MSVCAFVTPVGCAKTAEPIDMPLGAYSRVSFGGGQTSDWGRAASPLPPLYNRPSPVKRDGVSGRGQASD